VSLKADIHYPVGVGPFIPLVFVHGGGWTGGSKADMSNYVNAMTDAGYLVMAVDYRLAPTYKFPAQIQDIKCAVRYLRANANYYNIDAEKIGVWGGSAGGHLASLLGTANDTSSKTFEWDTVGQNLDQSSRVQAVVDLYGPVDLTYFFAGFNRFVSQSVFGSRDLTQQIFRDASPYWDITADDAPVLAIHGTDDQLVPVAQSQLFVDALNAAGVPSYFMPIEGANHGLGGVDLAPVYQTMKDFFAQELE
jgi:acetyl esterase/lipase